MYSGLPTECRQLKERSEYSRCRRIAAKTLVETEKTDLVE